MRFGSYVYYELGMKDSLNFDLKYKDSVYTKLIKRLPNKDVEAKNVKKDSSENLIVSCPTPIRISPHIAPKIIATPDSCKKST
jgi:hypothetical protein